jgi:hypothetical protein
MFAAFMVVAIPALAQAPVNGACGYSTMVRNGIKPIQNSGLSCVSGEATTIEDSPIWHDAWVWTCKGLHGGKDRQCHTTPIWPPKKR